MIDLPLLSAESRLHADNGLFSERLDAFLERSLADVRTFAEREQVSFEEIRRTFATWHYSALFAIPDTLPERRTRLHGALCAISQTLEGLEARAGVHAFVLAVDPRDPADTGFLGGSVLAREHWRGLRGGGETGARALKTAAAAAHAQTAGAGIHPPTISAVGGGPGEASAKKSPAQALKGEVYAGVRAALRTASGVRTAEMKWTNHDKLSAYGVRVTGWPADIPLQNPSTLSLAQNTRLLQALKDGTLAFVRDGAAGVSAADSTVDGPDEGAVDETAEWLVEIADEGRSDAEVGPSGPPNGQGTQRPPKRPREDT